jgi:hypothetical protein
MLPQTGVLRFNIRLSTPDGPRYAAVRWAMAAPRPAGIELHFTDSYCQFNVLYMNQDGLIR